MNIVMIGNRLRLEAFFSVLGQGTDPDTVEILVRPPRASTVALTVTRGAPPELDPQPDPVTGWCYAEFVPDRPGIHTYRVEGTGAAMAAREARFEVKPRTVSEP